MNDDIRSMIEMYNTYELDWMGDSINSLSNLTRHHIVKKENNGVDDINNYALLTSYSHQLLHYLETNYNNAYVKLNELFLELNKTKLPPSSEYYKNISIILKKVKKDIKNKRRNRVCKRR